MPRANRHYLPGHLWHVTHRCHNRDFLFKSARTRRQYLSWLNKSRKKNNFSILNYMVTSNHVHLLLSEKNAGAISKGMQYAAGNLAQEYNQNSNRSGAFWEDRYHATIIDSGIHLIKCLIYIDLNMVRAGKVRRPEEWKESGYHELIMQKQRYRLIDMKMLREYTGFDMHWLKKNYPLIVNEELLGNVTRNPIWTESIVVGRKQFILKLKSLLKRSNLKVSKSEQDGLFKLCNSD